MIDRGEMSDTPNQLTLDFLTWFADKPRTYAETMDAWRTSCPRLTVWEDAVMNGLIEVAQGESRDKSIVTLTSRGREVLASCANTYQADAPARHA